ncbi:hypothetical protein [Maribacter sp. HTCC2170]|uniref:hypothetical protein n=1 Tax=Maribacter sp. (strain HTCC2170 / KCCM 42371) TaxID=313603 RepID=UPI00006BE0DE|nr:hypothetical protein [Maribacter sp. HTCC2170]EAR00046.1 hypothetical protein FB2170_01692 [Maribacter sp. HTCC2170]
MVSELTDFLFNNYFLAFYALALVFSLVTYKKYFDTVLKYLPILITYTLITEILGLLIRDVEEIQIVYLDGYSYYNLLIYNIFDIIFFLFFFYVFWIVLYAKRFKRLIKYGGILFIIVSLVNPFFQDFVLSPQLFASTVGSVVLIACIWFYFIQLKSNQEIRNNRDLLFWISIGLLVFYSFYPFIFIIGHYDHGLYQELYIRQILHLLIAFMYSCFILGFLLAKRNVRQKKMP